MKKMAVIFIALVIAASSPARTITVDDDGPADFTTIQAGISYANDGDTIEIYPGTYTGAGNRDIDFHGKAITVRSQHGPESCIVDCQGTRRGFYFHSGEEADSVLDGLTITNGYASDFYPEQFEWSGGGILCRGGGPTIRNCIITGNTTYNGTGGGIRASSGIITNCIIRGNHAVGLGGFGPGGGGISCGGNATVSNCIITGNTAMWELGGGIRCSYGNARIVNCTIVGNSDRGIFCEWGADSLISNCTITGNYDGGLGCLDSDCTLLNSILWDNGSEEIAIYCLYGLFSTTISHSDIQGGQTSVLDPCNTIIWGPGNMDSDPCFADANNGEYHLKSQAGRYDPNTMSWLYDDVTSSCIDAGDPMSPIGAEPFPNGGIINMGAYGGTVEASKSYFGKTPCEVIVAGDVNGDCVIDFQDFCLMALHWCEDNNPTVTPEGAWGPTPEDGETSVVADPNVTLSWHLGDLQTEGYTVSYIVYFGTDEAALPELDTVERTSYDVSGLDPSTTYYWRIDTKRRKNIPPFTTLITPGNIWSFTTWDG